MASHCRPRFAGGACDGSVWRTDPEASACYLDGAPDWRMDHRGVGALYFAPSRIWHSRHGLVVPPRLERRSRLDVPKITLMMLPRSSPNQAMERTADRSYAQLLR